MSKLCFVFIFFLPLWVYGQHFRLAAPQISVDSVFFMRQAQVKLAFDLDSAAIRYTVNGGYPTSSAAVYEKPLLINKSAVVRAKATHPDFLPGTIAERRVMRISYHPDSTALSSPPDSQYAGRLDTTLFDLRKGMLDLKDGSWLGFRTDTVVAEAYFSKPITCKQLVVSTLFNSGAWIFPPVQIEVMGAIGDKAWQYIGVWSARANMDLKGVPADYEHFRKIALFPLEVDRIQIRVVPFGKLPDWHAGAGQPAWLFIDEILFL